MAILTPAMPLPVREKTRPVLESRALGLARVLIGSLSLILLLAQPANSFGQTVSREYLLKAVFLLNFSRFTEWPENAFQTTNSDFVIGVLGSDPFGPLIKETVKDERFNQRKFAVEHYGNVSDIKNCEILFISKSESGRLRGLVAKLKTRPILTVSDCRDAADLGVCVQFVTEENKIRLRINLDSLKSAHLAMSSELLRLADVVSVAVK